MLSTKSESAARYYVAMLKRLTDYCRGDVLDLNTVSPEFIDGFGDYLIRCGLTPSTIKLFKMSLRSVLKEAYGKENVELFRSAFRSVGSKNETETNLIGADDVVKIAGCKFAGLPMLGKVRDVFLFCLYAGGLTLEQLKDLCVAEQLAPVVPQQTSLIHRFDEDSASCFRDFVRRLTSEQYARALAQIFAMTGISNQLRTQSAADGWIALAVAAGLPTDLIAATVANKTAFVRNIIPGKEYGNDSISGALRKVADRVHDMKARWYVMRCMALDAVEADGYIRDKAGLLDTEFFDTYIPCDRSAKSGTTAIGRYLGSFLFFRCSSSDALGIKRLMKEKAYVFSSRESGLPIHVRDSEMLTFMLMSDVAADTIDYHFPEKQQEPAASRIGQTARIVVGNLSGHVGVVSRLSHDKYKVILEFQSLGGANVTADIPLDFLRFDD